MALNWTTTYEETKGGAVKMLIISESGAGKTTLLKTLPGADTQQMVILEAERGLLPLRKCVPPIPVLKINTIQDLSDAYDFLSRDKHFISVGLDSISEIAERVLVEALVGVKDPRQAYLETQDKMYAIIRQFRDLDSKNVAFNAKIEPMKDEFTGVIRYMAMMPGRKLGPQMPYFFDEVFILRKSTHVPTPSAPAYRFLQTEGDLQFVAKDRSGALAAIEKPDLGYIINKILTSK